MRKRTRFARIGSVRMPPHTKVLLNHLSRPLRDDEIDKTLAPMRQFQAALTQGGANRRQYTHMIDSIYHFLCLLEVLVNLPSLSSDKAYDQQCQDEFVQVLRETTERGGELIYSIGERQRKTGKFGATAGELNTLSWLCTNFHNTLECVDFKHYFQALNNSQKRLADIRAGRGIRKTDNLQTG